MPGKKRLAVHSGRECCRKRQRTGHLGRPQHVGHGSLTERGARTRLSEEDHLYQRDHDLCRRNYPVGVSEVMEFAERAARKAPDSASAAILVLWTHAVWDCRPCDRAPAASAGQGRDRAACDYRRPLRHYPTRIHQVRGRWRRCFGRPAENATGTPCDPVITMAAFILRSFRRPTCSLSIDEIAR